MTSHFRPWSLTLLIVLACAERVEEPQSAGPIPEPEPTRAAQVPALPPRAKVAGMWGIELWTHVRFPDQPDAPHRLQTLLAFPARTRWVLAPEVNPLGNVRIVYEHGQRMFLVEPGTPDSLELTGDGLRDQQRNMALRRALLVPEDFLWSEGKDGTRSADLGDAGRLEAHGPAGRPERILSWTAADQPSLQLVDIRWEESAGDGGRTWPTTWRLEQAQQVLWEETRTRGEVLGGVYTRSFLPPDRRAGARASAEAPISGSSGPCWVLLGSLPSDVGWDEVELVAELAVQQEREAGRMVQTPVTFTLRPDGRPAQVRLVLPPDSSPPTPWQREEGGSLFEMRWSGEELPAPVAVREALAELRRAAELEGRAPHGPAFLHRLPQGRGLRLVQDVR